MLDQRVYFKVAGVTYEGRQQIIEEMIVGQDLVLIAEPTNPYDPNAIGVWCCWDEYKGWRRELIGYVPKEQTFLIRGLNSPDGIKASVDEIIGGYQTSLGERAFLGVVVSVEMKPR